MDVFFFFFNDTATTEIYTLSLHDALPIWGLPHWADPGRTKPSQINHGDGGRGVYFQDPDGHLLEIITRPDRKSTRLNSSHANISYAVFCLKKKTHNYI